MKLVTLSHKNFTMASTIHLIPFLLLPFFHFIVYGISLRTPNPVRLSGWINRLYYLQLGISMYGITQLINHPFVEWNLASPGAWGISIRIDRLNLVLMIMISLIGLVVSKFSTSYLDGDKRQAQFLGTISGIIGSILLFILSENLLVLFSSWVTTSLLLQQLLIFYPDREGARLAARKKFILARLGDLSLLSALLLIYRTFGTGDLSTIFEQLNQHGTTLQHSGSIQLSGLLLAITAILKSAQLPFHGWLIEVMEAPTPVSALLHAGLINAGPFLLIRFAALLQLSTVAQMSLFVIGLLTALFGAFTFVHQPAIKNSLAYSSVAHMGFTVMLCGIGAYPAALLHLTAHSFYKAHAFLSSGSEVERNADRLLNEPARRTGYALLGFALSFLLCLLLGYSYMTLFASTGLDYSMLFLFLSLIVSGVIAHAIYTTFEYKSILRVCLLCLASLISFLTLEFLFRKLLEDLLPAPLEQTTNMLYSFSFWMLVILGSFLLLTTTFFRQRFGKLYEQTTIHLRNGLYINLVINKWMKAYVKK